MSLREGRADPDDQLRNPRPGLPGTDVVANEPREQQIQVCLKLSYGFGGHNACLVLTRP